jgi:two-component system chemotaxis sensor kinase CheA
MESLAEIFYEEASEMLQQMETILLAMEEQGATQESINELFRYAHSLKGNSGVMGFTNINRFTHGLENALDSVRKGTHPMSQPLAAILLNCVDVINRLVDASKTDGDVGDPACKELLDKITRLLKSEAPQPAAAVSINEQSSPPKTESSDSTEAAALVNNPEKRYRIYYNPGSMLDAENDPIKSLTELSEYASILGCKMEETIPALEEYESDTCYANWIVDVESTAEPVILRAILELSGEGAEVQVLPYSTDMPSLHPVAEDNNLSPCQEETSRTEENTGVRNVQNIRRIADAATIRVSTEKIDALFDLTSEIVIAQSMLTNTRGRVHDPEATSAITQMERYVRDLHEHVMAIRMIPVGYVFNRFPRMVRDLAATTHKDVHLEISGEDTELDRTLLEALTDPITHILRNCIDHGIETPQERLAAGKTEFGTVHLNAYQAEGKIYIEISDDGKGIDMERVRKKGVELGWIKPEDQPSPEMLYDFLFRPGFSTASSVTDVSGRGVGMDVVKKNIEQLGGVAIIQSQPGKGTRFLLKAPLTLAILDGLNLRVGTEHYIIPLTSVIETFQPESITISSALGEYEMVNIRGRFLPLIRLADAVGAGTLNDQQNRGLIIILAQDESQIAIEVDEIIGQHQVVMKSLETNFVRVPGFSGACILGDGHVALIVDVGELVRNAQGGTVSGIHSEAA